MSRQQDRRDLEPTVRIRMAEDDLDRMDEKVAHNRNNADMAMKGLDLKFDRAITIVADDFAKLETKFDQLEEKTETKVDGSRKVMVGVLISTLSVAIAIVAQVLVMRGGGG